jgi:Sigma-70 region 2
VQDAEVVAAVVAGNQDGFAAAYDQYADSLYAYCHSMLSSSDGAAGAVRDVFLIATTQLSRLRDPGKLGPWLHAVARNECLRRLNAAGMTSPPPKTAGDGALLAIELPAALRGEVLKACADNTPAGRADRATVAHRAGTFGPSGFPKAIGSPGPQWWQQLRRRPRVAAAVATMAIAAVAGAVLTMTTVGGSHRAQASTVANGSKIAGGSHVASGAPGASVRAGASPSGHPQASPGPGQPTPSVTALGSITSPAGRGTVKPSATPSRASASPSPSSVPSPSSPSVSPSPSTSPPPAQGILQATPAKLVLVSTSGKAVSGTFLLSAVDGPVRNWSITVPAAMAGKVTVAPAKGSLGSGGWSTITVTVTSKTALNTSLTIYPGKLTVTVLLSIKR